MKATQCPLCQCAMKIQSLCCVSCDCEVKGSFPSSLWDHMSEPQSDFLMAFVACRGNLKAMEKVLGQSYPTLRQRLDDLISGLNLDGLSFDDDSEAQNEQTESSNPPPQKSSDVLDAIAAGQLSVEAALKTLKGDV